MSIAIQEISSGTFSVVQETAILLRAARTLQPTVPATQVQITTVAVVVLLP